MYRYPINGMDYFSKLITVTSDAHSMGLSLKHYMETKIHHLFDGNDFDKVIVRNCFDRSGGISNKEKTDKLFNYMPLVRRIKHTLFEGKIKIIDH